MKILDSDGTTAEMVALHEAAHAVVSVLLGVRFTDVILKLPEARIDWPFDEADTVRNREARVACALAGGLVHASVLGKSDFRDNASREDMEIAERQAALLGIKHGRMMDEYLESVADRTADLLSGNGVMEAVTCVAAELMERERLTFEQVRRIVNRFVE